MKRLPAACSALLLLAGCATTPGEDRLAERDPLEGFNRGVWDVNQALDKVAIKPVTKVYRAVTPRPARRGISRIFANLSEPFSFINNLLQGKPDRAIRNLGRFAVNTTLGIGGLADQATKMGIKPAYEDFGQTLAVWGANGGPYLVLPILGPSTLRDGVGSGVAQFADPYRVAVRESGLSSTAKIGIMAGEVISTRSDLMDSGADSFLETSLDSYAAARSAYLQRRHAQIRNEDEDDDGGSGDTSGAAEGDAAAATAADSADTGGNTADNGAATPAPDAPSPGPKTGEGTTSIAPAAPAADAAVQTPTPATTETKVERSVEQPATDGNVHAAEETPASAK